MARRSKYTLELGDGTAGTDGGDGIVIYSRKAAKQAAKAEKQIAKAARADRAASRTAERLTEAEAQDKGVSDPMTGMKVKRYLGIARIVVPVAAPIVYQAVGAARARIDDVRARRLGVAPGELTSFSGRGTALYARTHNLANSVRELANRRGGDSDVRSFTQDARERLSDLEAAVRSAEQMPAARRRRAHLAVSGELDRLEARLLTLWGLDRTSALPSAES